MSRSLTHYLEQQIPLSEEELLFLADNIPEEKILKHTLLLAAGQISQAFYFVVKGCVRMYYLVDGVEKTTFFYTEGTFVSSYKSFIQQVPAPHFLQTVEDTCLSVISTESAHQLLQLFPRFEFLARVAMESELSVYQDMIASFVTLNAEQRYLKLLETQPDLPQRIPQHFIATYLGVSPETLSRIRKRIHQKSLS